MNQQILVLLNNARVATLHDTVVIKKENEINFQK